MGQVVRDTDPLVTGAQRVFLAIGGRELEGSADGTRLLLSLNAHVAANLRAGGFGEDRLRYGEDPDGRHTEDTWAAHLPQALEFLWRGWAAPPPR